jgi:cyclase
MYRPRVIPVLLLKENGLYKTKKFDTPIYIGDPINAVKIFNDAKADELIFLDINASKENSSIDYELLSKISEEAQMPFSYGGGLDSLEKINKVFKSGTEKIVLNSICFQSTELISEAAKKYGNQAIVISIDVRKENGEYVLYSHSGTKKENVSLENHLTKCELAGAGEFFINSIDKDGTREGYDLELFEKVSKVVSIPIIASGGADDEDDMVEIIEKNFVSATAAGSMFVFIGKKNAVMINYPEPEELLDLFK